MKRFLTGFFLPLCIFLLGGYGQRYACAHQAGSQFSAIRVFERSGYALDTGLDSHSSIIKSASTEKKTHLPDIAPFEEDEVREYELNSSKKHSGSTSFIIPNFYVQTVGYFFGHTKKSLPFSKHFSNITSFKWYLILQVFRI
jgi:hypothetical protein